MKEKKLVYITFSINSNNLYNINIIAILNYEFHLSCFQFFDKQKTKY